MPIDAGTAASQFLSPSRTADRCACCAPPAGNHGTYSEVCSTPCTPQPTHEVRRCKSSTVRCGLRNASGSQALPAGKSAVLPHSPSSVPCRFAFGVVCSAASAVAVTAVTAAASTGAVQLCEGLAMHRAGQLQRQPTALIELERRVLHLLSRAHVSVGRSSSAVTCVHMCCIAVVAPDA